MRTISKGWATLALCAMVVVLLTTNARADFAATTVTLNIGNTDLATQGAGPYATFSISLSGNTVSVTATGQNNFVFVDHNIIALNLSSAAGTVSNFSGANLSLANPLPPTVDGFGSFNFVLDDGAGFSGGGYSSLTFSFNISGGSGITSLSQLLATNGIASAAAHMALATNTACTGFAGNGGTQGTGTSTQSACNSTSVPDGGITLMLLGGALVGIETLRRKFRV
jgi:hypothetical protein